MRLTNEEIKDILASKGLICLNIEDYKNMDTMLHLQCKQKHNIDASIRTIRNVNFKCPVCDGKTSVSEKINDIAPPVKQGYRIIAVDNATENMGVSIFDNGKLVFYHLFHIQGDTITRLLKNRNLIEQVFIKQWSPDLMVFEDIQYQPPNILTFKVLSMLFGNSLVACRANDVNFETVLSKVWRAHFMCNAKNRSEQKKQSIAKVKEMYDINVNDDVAEAILLGKYAVDSLKRTEIKKLF